MKSKLLAMAVCLTALVTFNAAKAVPVNVIDMGNVNIGAAGYYTNTPLYANTPPAEFGGYNTSIIGTLPANSQITFSYTMDHGLSLFNVISPDFVLSSYGSYSGYNGDRTQYYVGSSSTDSRGFNSSTGYVFANGGPLISAGDSLVLTTANLNRTQSGHSGTTVITNTSNIAASFSSQFIGFLTSGGWVTAEYAVAALSAVPLPAAAYLFGSGLLALAGMSRMKKKQLAA